MQDNILWKLSKDTQKMLKEVQEEIKSIEQDLKSGSLLLTKDSDSLGREYAFNVGKIEGLEFIVEKLTYKEEGISDEFRE